MYSNSQQSISRRAPLPPQTMAKRSATLMDTQFAQALMDDDPLLQQFSARTVKVAKTPEVGGDFERPTVGFEFMEQNIFDPISFWLKQNCYITESMRIRRHVFEPTDGNRVYHFISMLITAPPPGSKDKNPKARMLKLKLEEVDNLIAILGELRGEVPE